MTLPCTLDVTTRSTSPEVEMEGDLAASLTEAEHTSKWAASGRFMAVLEDGLIWSTENFLTWDTIELPEDAAWIVSQGGSAIVTALGWTVYEELPGWQSSTVGITEYGDLPENARDYLQRIEELAGVPVDIISTGPDREQTIIKQHPFE